MTSDDQCGCGSTQIVKDSLGALKMCECLNCGESWMSFEAQNPEFMLEELKVELEKQLVALEED